MASLHSITTSFPENELPPAVLEMSKTGDDRYGALFAKVSTELQEDLRYLKEQALSSMLMLEKKGEETAYWKDLALHYLQMLHAKMEILERVEAFRDVVAPNKSLEQILGFCKNLDHEASLKSLLLSVLETGRADFCKELEAFFFCFEDPVEALSIIQVSHEYPANERSTLLIALKNLCGRKIRLRAELVKLIIPHIYMLLNNPQKLQDVCQSCKTFDEIQTLLTK